MSKARGQSIEIKSIFPYGVAGLLKGQDILIRDGVSSGVGMVGPTVGLAIENRFSLKELNVLRIAGWIPIQKGIGKIDIQTWGSELYREHRIGVGYGLPVSKTFRLGIEFDGMTYRFKESSPLFCIQSGIDFVYDISAKSKLGFQFQQSRAVKKINSENKLQRFQTSVVHQLNDNLCIGIESVKESGGSITTGNFLQWIVSKKLKLWGYLNYSSAEMMVGGQLPVGKYKYTLSM
ncbi:MAG: hypothetical protein RL131_34, partial [Bacteroidota bacterium]